MHLKSLAIKNFKSIEDLTIFFNKELSVFTGVNNSGKTTILEAIALWNECFNKIISQAGRTVKNKYNQGEYILGPSNNKYFAFEEINSIRNPYLEDIFRNRDKKNKIILDASVENDSGEDISISFKISDSVGKYVIVLEDFNKYNFIKFNRFFRNFPEPIDVFYASPVANIEQHEDFVTAPNIKDSIKKRKSANVLRNRIYNLYYTDRFKYFLKDLNFVLFNTEENKIEIISRSDINKDQRVIINYKTGARDVEKDIALLGSGTLQCIEILLNVYQQAQNPKDLNLILLDEPDSHIHRDIQKRLIEILLKFSSGNQIFITTHNESLIRNTPLKNLFHLSENLMGELYSMYKKDLSELRIPHFKGLYPGSLTPVIKSLGSESGLDFINAIEADRIIFVEGDDDARVIHRLLQEFPSNHNRKFMYWVMGGVSQIFDKISIYKTFFSEIRNKQTLWNKSVLIFDKDVITDKDFNKILEKLREFTGVPVMGMNVYTQESVLLTDFQKLSKLLFNYFETLSGLKKIDPDIVGKKMVTEYSNLGNILKERYSRSKIDEELCLRYKGSYSDKINALFPNRQIFLENRDLRLAGQIYDYCNEVIEKEEYFKLANKSDVENIINSSIKEYHHSINIETDFYEMIRLIDKSTWYKEWDYLKEI